MATAFPVKAQTKEETISWLKEKLDKCIDINIGSAITNYGKEGSMSVDYYKLNDKPANKILTIQLDECNLEIKFLVRKYEDVSELIPVTLVLPTIGIKLINSHFSYSAKIAYYAKEGTKYYTDSPVLISIQNKEENILERLQKALDHLSTFCTKKKETF